MKNIYKFVCSSTISLVLVSAAVIYLLAAAYNYGYFYALNVPIRIIPLYASDIFLPALPWILPLFGILAAVTLLWKYKVIRLLAYCSPILLAIVLFIGYRDVSISIATYPKSIISFKNGTKMENAIILRDLDRGLLVSLDKRIIFCPKINIITYSI
jgi:hypothetical protein